MVMAEAVAAMKADGWFLWGVLPHAVKFYRWSVLAVLRSRLLVELLKESASRVLGWCRA